jgi:hypothetical protein
MKKILLAAGVLAVALSSAAQSQGLRSVATLNGNEVLVVRPFTINKDCTTGAFPDVRVSEQPKSGSVRMAPVTFTFQPQRPDGPRAHCKGKDIEGMGVYYKPGDGFVGTERLVLKADFRDGRVDEMVVLVDVR